MTTLKEYIDEHPNYSYVISCAADEASAADWNIWSKGKPVCILRDDILTNPNVTFVCA